MMDGSTSATVAKGSEITSGKIGLPIGGRASILSMKCQISGIRSRRFCVEESRHGMNRWRSRGTSIRFFGRYQRMSCPSLSDTMDVMLCPWRIGALTDASQSPRYSPSLIVEMEGWITSRALDA